MLLSLYFSIIFRIFSEWFFHFSNHLTALNLCNKIALIFISLSIQAFESIVINSRRKKGDPNDEFELKLCVRERAKKELYWLENDLNRNRKELTVSLEELEYGSRQIYKMLNVCATERPCRMCSALTISSRTRYVCVCASEWMSQLVHYLFSVNRLNGV